MGRAAAAGVGRKRVRALAAKADGKKAALGRDRTEVEMQEVDEKQGETEIEGVWRFRGGELFPEEASKVEVWDAEKSSKRKTWAIMGGVHGNEQVGIAVVQRLVKAMSEGRIRLLWPAHEVLLMLGNPLAISQNARASAPDQDLNRSFTLSVAEPKSKGGSSRADSKPSYEQLRALELAPLLSSVDVLVDLHATNKQSEPFVRIAGLCTEEHLRIASWFHDLPGSTGGRSKLLLDPNYVLGGRICTTDEFVGGHGGVGVCVETGKFDDTDVEDEVLQRVIELLDAELGLCVRPSANKAGRRPWPGFPQTEFVNDFPVYGVKRFKVKLLEAPSGRGAAGDGPPAAGAAEAAEPPAVNSYVEVPCQYSSIFQPYQLSDVHVLTEQGFTWASGMGESNWQPVKAGTIVGFFNNKHAGSRRRAARAVSAAEHWDNQEGDSHGDEEDEEADDDHDDEEEEDEEDEEEEEEEDEEGDDEEGEEASANAGFAASSSTMSNTRFMSEIYAVTHDSVILFPKVEALWRPFAPLYWLARRIRLPFQADSREVSEWKVRWNEELCEYPTRFVMWCSKRIASQNEDVFLSALQNAVPGVTRKKGQSRDTLVKPDTSHVLDNAPNIVRGLQVKFLKDLGSPTIGGKGFVLPLALKSLQISYKDALDTGSEPKFDARARNLIYSDPSRAFRPIVVYPSTYRLGSEFYNRAWKPFFSPRIVLPFPVMTASKRGKMFVGREFGDSIKAVRESAESNYPGLDLVERGGWLYVEAALVGSAYLAPEIAPTPGAPLAVVVVGSTKAHTGKSYLRLAHALLVLSGLGPEKKLEEYHPVFTSRGEVVATYGYCQEVDLTSSASLKVKVVGGENKSEKA